MDQVLNASQLYEILVDQRSINQILRDDGGTDEDMEKFWEMVGFPMIPGEAKVVPLTIVLQNLAAVKVAHPFNNKIHRHDLLAFMTRQGFSDEEQTTLMERIFWLPAAATKNYASLITRLIKAVVRPGVLQG